MAPAEWRNISELPADQRPGCWPWLVETGSLTARVRDLDLPGAFRLDVLQEDVCPVENGDARLLGIEAGAPVTVREVTLNRGTVPLVFARSVIPRESSNGPNAWLQNLGDRPLGDALANVANMTRSEFQVVRLTKDDKLFERLILAIGEPNGTVWARRSCVQVNKQPILVNECFLSIPTS